MNNQLQIVTKEQAIKLKELGFDWEVHNLYKSEIEELQYTFSSGTHFNLVKEYISALETTFALKWFRDVHNLIVYLMSDFIGKWTPFYQEIKGGVFQKRISSMKDTYEEAESAALDYLIELKCKKQK